ncbi:hypothetical protein H310_09185 [Aphanomyces invadans]|uniref:Uncharacterized protein n=1 Tax=Aphanomyces invadans TaxID=157072 RepID=A0A024TWX8_9STRA|nr:hypothetical protein H310_09185 [Aphanomyces invadans]ETV97847.1 hypothetical protein H310_09185 [Aphanomyces invadans]|eukprot:XP_008873408.1 hypothetical protein H310_09185 [Aphanomyces invadans]
MHFEEDDDEIKARARAYFAVSQQRAAEAEATHHAMDLVKLKEWAKHSEGKCSDHMRAVLNSWNRSVDDFEVVAGEYGAAFHERVAGYVKQQRESIAGMAHRIKDPGSRSAP